MRPHPNTLPYPDPPAIDDIVSARVHHLYGLQLEVVRFTDADNGAEAFRHWLTMHCSLWMVLVRALQPDGPDELDPEQRLASGECSAEAALFLARSAEALSAQALWHLAVALTSPSATPFAAFRNQLRQRQAQWLARMPVEQATAWQHFLAADNRLG